jgi:hypothetical protein
VLADNPVAWWRLNELTGTVAADAVAPVANGTYTGPVILGQPGVDAHAGFSIRLTNQANYVDIGAVPTKLRFGLGSPFSIEAWAAWDRTVSPLGSIVTEAYAGDGVIRYMLGTYNGSGWTQRPTFGWYNGGWQLIQGPVITDSAWHHFVGTYDGTNFRLYVDGALATGPTATGTQPTGGNETLYIGRRWDNNETFDGFVDEVAFYGVALSSTQVAAHYAARDLPPTDTRVTAIWAEVAIAGPTPDTRVTGVWLEVATEEFWHGFGIAEEGSGDLTYADASVGLGSGDPGLFQGAAAIGRGRGRSKATGGVPNATLDYRKAANYRNASNYRG